MHLQAREVVGVSEGQGGVDKNNPSYCVWEQERAKVRQWVVQTHPWLAFASKGGGGCLGGMVGVGEG